VVILPGTAFCVSADNAVVMSPGVRRDDIEQDDISPPFVMAGTSPVMTI
jgi:hypothetical protein